MINPSATNIKNLDISNQNASKTNPESLVRRALDDIALIVGGAAALHQLDDDLVWTVIKRLDRIRVRLLRDLRGLTSREPVDRVREGRHGCMRPWKSFSYATEQGWRSKGSYADAPSILPTLSCPSGLSPTMSVHEFRLRSQPKN